MINNAIVTGATGFVGRWLIWELQRQDINVVAVVRPNSSREKYITKDLGIIKIVECDMRELFKLPDYIGEMEDCAFFHLAWEGVYGPKRVDLQTQLNCVSASKSAVEVAAKLKCKRFIGLGSIMEKEAVAVAEADGAMPGMPYIYGEAKHMAHLLTKATAVETGIDHLWPVLTNPYGENDDSTRFVNATLRKIMNDEPLEFSAGTQIYDFIHIEDAVKAIVAVAKYGKPFHSYLIGSGKAAPLRQFVETIGQVVAPEKKLLFGSIPYSGVQLGEEIFSIESLTRDTGFSPKIEFGEGICRTMKWLREKEER